MAVGISRSIGIGMKKCCGGTISGGGGGGGGGSTTGNIDYTFGGGSNCGAYEVTLSINQGPFTRISNKLSGTNPVPVSGSTTLTNGDQVSIKVEALAPTTVACQQNFLGNDVFLRVGNDPVVLANNPVVMVVSSPNTQIYTFTYQSGLRDFVHIDVVPTN